jgi:hypothetical protein
VLEVLRRRAQHRRAADVDHLDRVLLADVSPRGDLPERVEVDADEVERRDSVPLERLHVLRDVAPREDARMDAWVEGLDAPPEELRHLRQLLDLRDGQAELRHVLGGPAARDELHPEVRETPGKRVQPGLVEDGDKGPPDHDSGA